MVCTTRTGAATAAGSLAYARYVIEATLTVEHERAAKYYAGDGEGRDVPEPAISMKHDLSPAMARRLGIDRSRSLTLTEVANLMNNRTAGGKAIEGKKKHSPHASVAAVFGLDPRVMPSIDEIRNVLAGKRIDGSAPTEPPDRSAIEGLEQRQAQNAVHFDGWLAGSQAPDLKMIADYAVSDALDPMEVERQLTDDLDIAIEAAELADVSPLSPEARALHGLPEPPEVPEYLRDVSLEDLRQRRDGVAAQWDKAFGAANLQADTLASAEPKPLSGKRIESAVRQFKAAIGVAADRDATDEEIQRVADGRINRADYQRQITTTSPAVGYEDLTFSADKSVSIAYALAPTEAERNIILAAVNGATDDAMAYAEQVLGVARRGAGGTRTEPAELCWVGFQHYTSRPATDIVRLDAEGREYTDTRSVPGGDSDVNLHQHRIVFSSVMTDGGHIGSLDLSRLKGETKVFGAVFHAGVATRLREHGVEVTLGPNGEARISNIPEWVRQFHSRRATQGETSAREWAASQGRDWDTLSGDQKARLIDRGMAKERQAKTKDDRRLNDEGSADIQRWRQESEEAGYRHRSVLRPDQRPPALTREQRLHIAREAALPLLDDAFQRRAVLTMGELREITARGLIVSGLGEDAQADINAVIKSFRDHGVRVGAEMTGLILATDVGDNGRPQTVVTTERAVALEENLVTMVRAAATDRSGALTADQIDRAAERFLAKHPRIDPSGGQWKSQLVMAHQIGEGGRISLSIGAAGSGKTSAVVATLVDAWHAENRTVYGMTVPWKASAALRDAGVDHAVAIEAFLKRVADGKYQVDRNTVIVADEVSQIGIRHQSALLKLAAGTGAQLVEIGDPKQCQAVETPAIDLMAKAIGDENIPKLLTTIRQQTERDRQVATMFRNGQAADGIAALRQDGRFHLVAGGAGATVERTTQLWRNLTDANAANPDYSLLVMTPTNNQARQIGVAIRDNRRAAGEIGLAETILKARDPNSGETYDLPVSVGDKLRMFTRVFADQDKSRHFANNGDVVEIMQVRPDGLVLRNTGGDEGMVRWSQMKPWRAPKNDPVMVTYGYAVTIDTAQSVTKTEAILMAAEGSRQIAANKAYTGLSRHEVAAHLVISDQAERKEIVGRQMLGQPHVPSQEEVVRNVAANMSRFQTKATATDMLRRASNVMRSSIGDLRRGIEPVQRREGIGGMVRWSRLEAMRQAPIVERLVALSQIPRRVAQVAREAGRGMGMSR